MKIVKPQVHYFGAVPTDYSSSIQFIELCARTCYKSEDKITDDSAEKFVKKLIKAGHLAMIEHSNFVVRTDFYKNRDAIPAHISEYALGKYLSVVQDYQYVYVGGNLTAWANRTWQPDRHIVDNVYAPFIGLFGDLFPHEEVKVSGSQIWQVCPYEEIPKELHRYSMKFICDRGVSHELVRHRPCSFAQESTRYVNYAGKEMEFIEPAGFGEWHKEARETFTEHMQDCEFAYADLSTPYCTPQQARAVLPNALKTEVVVTADAAEWAHIKKLRTHKSAHPDMVHIMGLVPWERMGV